MLESLLEPHPGLTARSLLLHLPALNVTRRVMTCASRSTPSPQRTWTAGERPARCSIPSRCWAFPATATTAPLPSTTIGTTSRSIPARADTRVFRVEPSRHPGRASPLADCVGQVRHPRGRAPRGSAPGPRGPRPRPRTGGFRSRTARARARPRTRRSGPRSCTRRIVAAPPAMRTSRSPAASRARSSAVSMPSLTKWKVVPPAAPRAHASRASRRRPACGTAPPPATTAHRASNMRLPITLAPVRSNVCRAMSLSRPSSPPSPNFRFSRKNRVGKAHACSFHPLGHAALQFQILRSLLGRGSKPFHRLGDDEPVQ